jgi:hypothetical protein
MVFILHRVHYWDVWFNSINIDNAATSASAAFRHAGSGASYMDIRNNNFAITNAGASGALCFMTGSGVTTNSLNYNNYFKQGASGCYKHCKRFRYQLHVHQFYNYSRCKFNKPFTVIYLGHQPAAHGGHEQRHTDFIT